MREKTAPKYKGSGVYMNLAHFTASHFIFNLHRFHKLNLKLLHNVLNSCILSIVLLLSFCVDVCVCVCIGRGEKWAYLRRSRISPPTATFRLNT